MKALIFYGEKKSVGSIGACFYILTRYWSSNLHSANIQPAIEEWNFNDGNACFPRHCHMKLVLLFMRQQDVFNKRIFSFNMATVLYHIPFKERCEILTYWSFT